MLHCFSASVGFSSCYSAKLVFSEVILRVSALSHTPAVRATSASLPILLTAAQFLVTMIDGGFVKLFPLFAFKRCKLHQPQVVDVYLLGLLHQVEFSLSPLLDGPLLVGFRSSVSRGRVFVQRVGVEASGFLFRLVFMLAHFRVIPRFATLLPDEGNARISSVADRSDRRLDLMI